MSKFSPALRQTMDFLFVAIMPAGLSEFVFIFSTRHLADWAQLIVAMIFFAGFALWAFLYSGERMRKRTRAHYMWRIRIWYPLAASFGLLLFAVYVFSYLTYCLVSLGYAEFWPTVQSGEWRQFTYHYYWHFVDLVPGFNITQSLLWEPPMIYKNRLSGLLVLVFQFSVVGPVIAAWVTWYRLRKNPPKTFGADVSGC